MSEVSGHDGGYSLRVVEFGDEPGIAMCGMLLAALGAKVTKFITSEEAHRLRPPVLTTDDGREVSAQRAYLDRDKSQIVVDQSVQADTDRLRQAVEGADLFITHRPDEDLQGLGLDFATLRQQFPALVTGRSTELGERGAYGQWLGGEFQALALGGLLSITGERDRQPIRYGGSQGSYSAGLALLSGVMFGLYAKAKQGRATSIRTSTVRAAAYIDWKSHIYYEDEGRILERGSDTGPLIFKCSDGHVGLYYWPHSWNDVKNVLQSDELDDERFATQASRDTHRDELRAAMERAGARFTKSALYERFQAKSIPAGAVVTLPELLEDPQYQARDVMRPLAIDGIGEATIPSAPWTRNGVRAGASSPEAGR